MEEYEPKISGVEAAFLMATCVFFDGLDAIATFLDVAFGAGEVIKIFIDAVASPILILWVTLKGVGASRTIAASIVELVPIINTLPIRTITMAFVVWADRHPEEAEAIVKSSPAKRPAPPKPKL